MVGKTKQKFSDVKFLPPGMLRTRLGLKTLKWTQNGQFLTDSKNFFVSNLGFLIRIHPIHVGNDETKFFYRHSSTLVITVHISQCKVSRHCRIGQLNQWSLFTGYYSESEDEDSLSLAESSISHDPAGSQSTLCSVSQSPSGSHLTLTHTESDMSIASSAGGSREGQ